MIKNLPGIELDTTVAEAWIVAQDSEWERPSMAPVAVEYGYLDALEYVVESLDRERPWASWRRPARVIILRHTEARGTNEEIRQWFEQNKDRLVFDPETKKFRVGEPE